MNPTLIEESYEEDTKYHIVVLKYSKWIINKLLTSLTAASQIIY